MAKIAACVDDNLVRKACFDVETVGQARHSDSTLHPVKALMYLVIDLVNRPQIRWQVRRVRVILCVGAHAAEGLVPRVSVICSG